MRMSSFLTATAFATVLAASSGAMATDFSGIPPMPQQLEQDPTTQQLAQFPADPPVQMNLNHAQPSPYDSPNFVVPPYEIRP